MANWNVVEFRNKTGYGWDVNKQHFTITDLVDSTSSQISLAIIKKQGMESTVLKYIHLSYPWLIDTVKTLNDIRIVSYEPERFQLLFEINWVLKHVILTEKNTYLNEAKRREKLLKFLENYWEIILSHFPTFKWSDLWEIEDYSINDSIIFFSLWWYDFGCYEWHNKELIEILLSQWVRLSNKCNQEKEIQDRAESEMKFLEMKWKCIAIIETWFPNLNLSEIEDIAFPNKDSEMIYFSYKWTLYSVLAFPKNEVEESFIWYTPYPHLYRVK